MRNNKNKHSGRDHVVVATLFFFYYILGANLGSHLHGDVFVIDVV